ncbi:hypothetical protein BCON_0028g00130 [Botryotinia convoluta]|uniref:Fungal N-terminal domain-containing protein n=1 Tax=Botryotinia convoluta TaxID=54673 RepID=A0A4Z1IIQ6_9HELO|nr:hypothetical protein BCON_0028g00130 [Botryotinia convoluta]
MTFSKTISNVMHSDGTPRNVLLTFFDYAIIAASHIIQKWEQILEYFDNLITEKMSELTPIVGDEVEFVEASRKRMRQCFRRLKMVAEILRDKRQEALDLRDGLFNVSAVMESRAATSWERMSNY